MSKLKTYTLRKAFTGEFLARVNGLHNAFEIASVNFKHIPIVSIAVESGVCLSLVFNNETILGKKKGGK